MDGPELPGDDGDPGGEEGHGHGEGEAHQVIGLLYLYLVGKGRVLGVGDIGGCRVVSSWGESGEEGGRSGDNDHADDQTGPDQEPVHAAVLLEENSGQEEGHRWCWKEDGGAVPYGQPLDSLEYGEEHEAAHHCLRCDPPPGGEVWRGEDGGPGAQSGVRRRAWATDLDHQTRGSIPTLWPRQRTNSICQELTAMWRPANLMPILLKREFYKKTISN